MKNYRVPSTVACDVSFCWVQTTNTMIDLVKIGNTAFYYIKVWKSRRWDKSSRSVEVR